jgi:hypothetical protein
MIKIEAVLSFEYYEDMFSIGSDDSQEILRKR